MDVSAFTRIFNLQRLKSQICFIFIFQRASVLPTANYYFSTTVNSMVAVFPLPSLAVAVIVVFPAFFGVNTPLLLIVPTASSLLSHVIVLFAMACPSLLDAFAVIVNAYGLDHPEYEPVSIAFASFSSGHSRKSLLISCLPCTLTITR